MKDKVSLKSLIFAAAALFVFVLFCIFTIFNTAYQRTDHIIQLPREQLDTSFGYKASVTGIQLADPNELVAADTSLGLLVRSIPSDVPYQIRGLYKSASGETRLNIYYRDGKCKVVSAADTASERHTLILADRYYTWSKYNNNPQMFLSDSPYLDAGYAFIGIQSLRGDNDISPAENESFFGLVSLSFAFTSGRVRHVYTVSSESGCIFSYSARRGGQVLEQFQIETLLLGIPPESQFSIPGEK